MPESFVNQAIGTGVTSGSAITVTTGALTVGNILIACIASTPSTGTSPRSVSSIVQTGVTWNASKTNSNGKLNISIWVGLVGSSPSTSCLITMSAAVAGLNANVSQFSGVSTTSDSLAGGTTGTSVTPSTSTYTVNSGGDLVIIAEAQANGTTPTASPASPFNTLTFAGASTVIGAASSYSTMTTAGAKSASTWTITSAVWVSTVLGLKITPLTSTLSGTTQAMATTPSKTANKALTADAITTPTIVVKQSSGTQANTGNTTISKAFTSNVTAGSMLMACVSSFTTDDWATPTDSQGNTYTLAVLEEPPTTSSPSMCGLYYAIAKTSGACTVTVDNSLNGHNIHLHVYEVSGVNKLDQIGVNFQSGGTTAATVSTAGSTTVANELVLVLFGQDNVVGASWTPGAGYGPTVDTSGVADCAFSQVKIISSTGTQTATATSNNADLTTGVIATFFYYSPPLSMWSVLFTAGTGVLSKIFTALASPYTALLPRTTNKLEAAGASRLTTIETKQLGKSLSGIKATCYSILAKQSQIPILTALASLYTALLPKTVTKLETAGTSGLTALETKQSGKLLNGSEVPSIVTVTKQSQIPLLAIPPGSAGNSSKFITKVASATTVTGVATLLRSMAKSTVAVTAQWVGSIQKQCNKAILGVGTISAAGILKQTARAMSAVESTAQAAIATGRAQLFLLVSNLAVWQGTITRQTGKSIPGTEGPNTAFLARSVSFLLTAITLGDSATVLRSIGRNITAVASKNSANLLRSIVKNANVSLGMTAAIARSVARPIQAMGARLAGTTSKFTSKLISSTQAGANGSLAVLKEFLFFTASIMTTWQATVPRQIAKTVSSVSVASRTTLVRSISRVVQALLSPGAGKLQAGGLIQQAFTAVLGLLSATNVRNSQKIILSAGRAAAGATARSTGYHLSGSFQNASVLARGVQKTLAATFQSGAAAISASLAKLVQLIARSAEIMASVSKVVLISVTATASVPGAKLSRLVAVALKASISWAGTVQSGRMQIFTFLAGMATISSYCFRTAGKEIEGSSVSATGSIRKDIQKSSLAISAGYQSQSGRLISRTLAALIGLWKGLAAAVTGLRSVSGPVAKLFPMNGYARTLSSVDGTAQKLKPIAAWTEELEGK